MSAFTYATRSFVAGATITDVRDTLLSAMLAAGFPTPAVYAVSATTNIYSYNLPIPGSARVVTFLLQISFTSSCSAQIQLVDSTRYNSSSGVVTNGMGWTSIGVFSSSLTNGLFECYRSNSSGVADGRFNTIVFSGIINFMIAPWLPFLRLTGGGYPGDYNLTSHCLATLVNPSSTASDAHEVAGWIVPGFNPYSSLFASTSLTFDSTHKSMTTRSTDSTRPIISPVFARYTGDGSPTHSVFGDFGPDIGYCSGYGLSLIHTFASGTWRVIRLNTSGAIVLRIA